MGTRIEMSGCLILLILPALVQGHASLVEPPSRAAMHLYGFPQNPVDYQHNEGFCGGFSHQFSPAIGGRCGICGDAWDANPREHEAPLGKYANGIIVRSYQPGQEITVSVLVTANHKGYFTFRLCRNNNVNRDPDQSCFEEAQSLLQVAPSGDYRFPVTTEMGTGEIGVRLRLPSDWQCDQCILQWTYTAGNSWGVGTDGVGGLGLGPQEHFRACADISIGGSVIVLPTLPPPTIPVVTAAPPAASSPAPGNSPAPGAGQTCVAVGAWAGDSSMAAWCVTNCFAPTPFCPADRCDCVDSAPAPLSTSACHALGAWSGDSGMDSWCTTNCNHPIPYCPPTQCSCDETSAPLASTAQPPPGSSSGPSATSAPAPGGTNPPAGGSHPLQGLLSAISHIFLLFLSLFLGANVASSIG